MSHTLISDYKTFSPFINSQRIKKVQDHLSSRHSMVAIPWWPFHGGHVMRKEVSFKKPNVNMQSPCASS